MSQCGNKDRPGCGAELVWGRLPDGRKIPLDLAAPVYQLGPFDAGDRCYPIERVSGYKVGHAGICPIARNFTRSRKRNFTRVPAGEPARATGREKAAGD
jgi:hypothetical protein